MSLTRLAALVAAISLTASLVVAPPPVQAQTTPGTPTASGAFLDEPNITAVHRPAVYALVAEDVVRGCTDAPEFCPEDAITRQQMASFIGRALGLAEVEADFEDVDGGTHAGYIGALSEAGITTGCTVSPDEDGNVPEGDYYCPRDSVTREQMATFITRAYDLLPAGAPGFDDVASGGVHSRGINGVAAAMVTTGCTETEFCPRENVTRQQMASFIARAMGLLRDLQGCPTTVGPYELDEGFRTASDDLRFPVNAADRIGDQLYIFSIDLIPGRLTVDRVGSNGVLSTGDVVRNVEIPSGRRTWATEVIGDNLYFGQDFTGSAPTRDLYHLGRNSGTPRKLAEVPGTEFWDITSDEQGRLYIGTSVNQTVHRYTPGTGPGGSGGQLDQLRFGGAGTNGQVTQLEYDAQDDTLYIGTGRFTGAAAGSARLLAVDEVSTWQPGTANQRTARELLPGGEPGLDGVSSITPGVYSLEVTDDLIAVGFETSNARYVTLERTEEPIDVPDPEPVPDQPDAGTQSVPEDLGTDPDEDGPHVEGGELEQPLGTASSAATDADVATAATTTAQPAAYRVRDNVTLSGESKVESVRIDPASGAVFAAGATTGRIYRISNPGVGPSTTQVQQFAQPIVGAVNRDMFLFGNSLVGVASTGETWSISRTTGSSDGRNSPRNLADAGATVGTQLPQSMAVGNGRVAVGANNAIFLHTIGDHGRRTVTAPGEPKTMTAVGNQLYAGMYPAGSVFRQPLTPGTGGAYQAGTNVATWGGTYGRPRDIHDTGLSNRMLIAARASASSANALVSYQVPSSGGSWPSASITPTPIAGQEVYRVTSTADGRQILGGTGSNARVVSRPVAGGNQQWSQTPVPGGGTIRGLESSGTRIQGLTENGTWFELERANGQVVRTRRVLDGPAGNLAHHDGWLYAVNRNCLVAIDIQRGRVETLQRGLDSRVLDSNFLVAVDPDSPSGRGDAYVIRGEELIGVRHRQR